MRRDSLLWNRIISKLLYTKGLEAFGGLNCPERQLEVLISAVGLADTEVLPIMVPGSHTVLLTDVPSHDLNHESVAIQLTNDQKVCMYFFFL